jgi:hypothetical protein
VRRLLRGVLLCCIGHAQIVTGSFDHRVFGAGQLLVIALGALTLSRCLAAGIALKSDDLATRRRLLRKGQRTQA